MREDTAVEWFNHQRNPGRDRVADLIEIARFDLPRVAAFGVVAMQAHDRDLSRSMLHRVFVEALAADCEYLAELADTELRELELDAAAGF
jgi:hypothetical protein